MAKTIVRTENHGLVTTEVVRQDMARTIAAYRRVVRLCATIALAHWPDFKDLRAQERQQVLEQLIHATKKRPLVRYPMMARVLGQMPSYLRRAALSASLGAVSSYLSNYDNWLDDAERDRGARPPRLGLSNVYPSLYGGNMILEDSKLSSVKIKLLSADGQWRFSAPMKVKGRMKRLPHRLDLSPSLVLKGAKAMLVCPVAVTPPRYCKSKDVGRVCAVDVGINTALTAVVVYILWHSDSPHVPDMR